VVISKTTGGVSRDRLVTVILGLLSVSMVSAFAFAFSTNASVTVHSAEIRHNAECLRELKDSNRALFKMLLEVGGDVREIRALLKKGDQE